MKWIAKVDKKKPWQALRPEVSFPKSHPARESSAPGGVPKRANSGLSALFVEPHVFDAPAAARQVVERVQSVEMIDDAADGRRLGQPGDSRRCGGGSVRVGPAPAPVGDASALGTKGSRGSVIRPSKPASGPRRGSLRLRSRRPTASRSAGRPCSCRPRRPGMPSKPSGPRRKDTSLRSSAAPSFPTPLRRISLFWAIERRNSIRSRGRPSMV